MPQVNSYLYNLSIWIIPLVIAIVFHEVAYGWVANFFGDTTAKDKGRLSFNPLTHVDPVGTLVLPAILAISGAPVFGWAKPVPVIQEKLRNPRFHMMIVAFAGPGMNLILALFGVLFLAGIAKLSPGDLNDNAVLKFLFDNFQNFVIINIFLAVFNLIPLPPFDGSHILEGILPETVAVHYRKLRQFGFPLILLLIVVLPMVSPNIDPIGKLIVPPVQYLLNIYFSLVGLAG